MKNSSEDGLTAQALRDDAAAPHPCPAKPFHSGSHLVLDFILRTAADSCIVRSQGKGESVRAILAISCLCKKGNAQRRAGRRAKRRRRVSNSFAPSSTTRWRRC